MGYSTDFIGSFQIHTPVDEETAKLLRGLQQTRRMGRDVEKLKAYGFDKDYGVEGEFFVEDTSNALEKEHCESIINYNVPPSTQPSLWCQWELLDDNQTIIWDGVEKFYEYVPWITYFIEKILAPRGYIVNGSVAFRGEFFEDFGVIHVRKNQVTEIYQSFGDFFSV